VRKKRAKRSGPLSAATMGPGKERFATADLMQSPRDFVTRELAKPPAARFEAVCFDARQTPLPDVLGWIRGLDEVERAEDDNRKNDHGYYIRRVVVVRSRRAFAAAPRESRERPDITWIATADPSDVPTIYRRHLTEQFEGVLGLFARTKGRRR
jgi:hypothetical protein